MGDTTANPPYNGQLDAFELYHRIQEKNTSSPSGAGLGLPALGHALAGSAGTAISHLILYPLDLSIIRLQVQKQLRGANEAPSAGKDSGIEYNGILDAVRKIFRNEGGLKAFYAGCLTDTAKSIVDAFLFFLLYTFLRTRRLQRLGKRNLPVPDELGIGITAGLFSKFVTTPISQIVTRKQTAAMVAARNPSSSSSSSSLSVSHIARQIHAERGITGFWAGYRASMVLTMNPALTFLFHNLLSRTLLPANKRAAPGPRLTFVLAALSKAGASATMYPFSLAKTRAQLAAPEKKKSDAEKADTRPLPKRAAAFVVQQVTRPSPVVSSLKHVYATEGLAALYSGLSGEVLKGFLGHGLTMLLKERIHVMVVAGYFVMLKVLRRSREGSRGLREDVAEEMGRVAQAVSEAVSDVVESVGEKVAGSA